MAQKKNFSPTIPILIVLQILIAITALAIWTVRLLQKGRALIEKKSSGYPRRRPFKARALAIGAIVAKSRNSTSDDKLYSKAKEHLASKLNYDFEDEKIKRQELTELLQEEYDKSILTNDG